MNKKTIIIIIVMTLMAITANMAHPVTPKLVEENGYDPIMYGALFATMAFANLLASPIFGRLSDKHGRKLFLIIGAIGYGLAQLGFGFLQPRYAILSFRFIAGAFACSIFVSGMAYLVDVTKKEYRSKAMAYYTSILGAGMAGGYLLGGLIGNYNYRYSFVAQAIGSVLVATLIFLVVKESHTDRKARTINTNIIVDFKKYSHTILPVLLIAVVLTSFTDIGFNNTFNLYMNNALDFEPLEIGYVMAVTGAIGLFTNIVIFPILKRKFNDAYVLRLSMFVIVVTLTVVALIDNQTYQVIVLIPFFAAIRLYKPLIQSIISKLGERNGEVMGLNNAAHAIGMIAGSFIAGGIIYDINPIYSVYTVAGTCLVAFLLIVVFFKKVVKV
ncbi:MFS transporter [Haloplasma contractile]|uniref:Transporter major facilitator family protein n=1 Tax=Haloplasma contractile SSD-17B TaxID=1033810 RepID=U2DYN7_9MOLU|nr:MFS transporter [Haloplasma contractile]ERJ13362.1 transporter major facilitator family protein [Haloplasma contractile SSD-17B]